MDTFDQAQDEALARNDFLIARHGRLPSYSLWDGGSVGPPERWDGWWAECKGGVSQVLSRLAYGATISHLRRINIPIGNESQNSKIRQIEPQEEDLSDDSAQMSRALATWLLQVRFASD